MLKLLLFLKFVQYEHLLHLDFVDYSEGEDSLEVGVPTGFDF